MNQSLDAAWSRLLIPSELVQSPFNAPTAKFWLSVMNELKNRGVKDILIAAVDGLKGFSGAITSIFPKA